MKDAYPFRQASSGGLLIAELLDEYRAVAANAEPSKPKARSRPGLEEVAVNIPRAPPQPVVVPEEENEENAHAHAHAHANFNANAYANDDDNDIENENDPDTEDAQTVTDTTTSTTSESPCMPPHKLTKAEARAMKKAARAAKSQSKAFKNQAKHAVSVRTEDVAFVATVLHGDNAANRAATATHPLASDKTIEEVIQRNMGFMANIQDHKKQLLLSITQRRKADRERRKSGAANGHQNNHHHHNATSKKRRFSSGVGHDDDADNSEEETEYLLAAVLTKLGVDAAHIRTPAGGPANGAAATKKGASRAAASASGGNVNANLASLIANLKTLVKDDLERHENEFRETCIRAGGFWRFVGKPVFDRMTRIAGELDWKTGVKIH
ncbi:hypothetical protein A1O3_04833 [Capronia epimyces CBS 606.96]|uniref:Uncharacterized protein n=1 Tax=Capronia epimyces CBS 606.96 TaxID=1182542 RepID=W9Y4L1_9EURO|nr:uncharacterized protein A1O3_04833 [Capronia epimyces CBS 606.96]EXJ84166.1 hypothetical protein A1O3_04833 [Capronia epimyces CBS 606.96]